MRIVTGAIAATFMLLIPAGSAAADWSDPQTISVARNADWTVAVNARGDTAVAWATHGDPAEPPVFRGSVYVAVRSAAGRVRTRRLWSSRRAGIGEIAVALDRRGEATVAWNANTRRQSTQTEGLGTIRAAYGRRTGRWRVGVIGRASGDPRLAVAPDRRVLLAWVSNAYRSQISAAWRTHGRRFGKPRRLKGISATSAPHFLLGARPAFDTAGAAYLAGICDGTVLRARPKSRRFRTIFELERVADLTLSLAGSGAGVASWTKTRCSTSEIEPTAPGGVFASVLQGGRFGQPLRLTGIGVQGRNRAAVAASGGGGTVSWSEPAGVFSASFAPHVPITTEQSPLGIVPVGVDGGGDQVLAGAGSSGVLAQFGVLMRPAGGGALQHAPNPFGALAVSTPVGRRVALVWDTNQADLGGTVALSLWRP